MLSECLFPLEVLHRVDGVENLPVLSVPVLKFAVKCIYGFVNGGSGEAMFQSFSAHVN